MPKKKKRKNGTLSSRSGFVHIDQFVVLRQTRDGDKDGDTDIVDLSRGIASDGLLQNLVLAEWNRKKLREYAELVGELPGNDGYTAVKAMRRIRINKRDRYLVLIAGHRRTGSVKLFVVHPDTLEGLEDFEGLSGEECYQKVFPEGIPVKIYIDPPPFRAIGIQMEENLNRKSVPNHVQAKALQILYKVAKVKFNDPNMSIASFARTVEMKETTVRQAIGFRELLPQSVIDKVEEGKIPWGCATELLDLAKKLPKYINRDTKKPWTRDEINRVLVRLSGKIIASIPKHAKNKVAIFRREISNWKNEALGQLVMFGDREDLVLKMETFAEHILDRSTRQRIGDFSSLLEDVEYALRNGWIENGNLAPFYSKEARSALVEILEANRNLNSLLEIIMESDAFQELELLVEENLKNSRKIEAAGEILVSTP